MTVTVLSFSLATYRILPAASWVNSSGSGPEGRESTTCLGCGVDHLDLVVVADGDQHEFAVFREFDAARPLTDLDRLDDGPAVGIDHGHGIALFVRYVGHEGGSGRRGDKPRSQPGKQTTTPHASLSVFNAACIWFRADRRQAYRVPKPDAENLPAAKPRRPCVRRPAGSAGEAADSSRAASAVDP